MFWIHDILVRIRIRGSVPLLFFFLAFKMSTKNKFFCFFFLKVHLRQSSKIKGHKEVTKHLKSRFFQLFLLNYRMIRIWIRANNDGSGSWRPKNLWILLIRIRIHNTLKNYKNFSDTNSSTILGRI